MVENTAIKEEIEQVLLDAEKALGLHITIHDRTGRFHFPDGSPLLYPTRTMHSHSVFKKTDPGKCIADCYYSVNKQAKNRAAAWEHLCWKGVIEIIVPIMLNSEHLLTLFGGPFRPASGDAPSAEIAKLPAADSIKLQRAARILAVLAEG